MVGPEQSVETLECVRCGQPFAGSVLRFPIPSLNHTSVIRSLRCPACLAKVPQEQAQAEAQRLHEREADWARICPDEFRLRSENDGATDLTRLRAEAPLLDDLLAWADTDRKRGLLLRGPTGTCKTRAMWRVLRRLWEKDLPFHAWTAATLEIECQTARDGGWLGRWLKQQTRVPVFFLDDLGKMRWYPSTEGLLFEILDARMSHHRPVLITTNETGETLEARLSGHIGEAMVRRLRDYCTCLEFVRG